MKDFFDLDLPLGSLAQDEARLLATIRATFERRRTTIPASLPTGLTERVRVRQATDVAGVSAQEWIG